MLKTTARSCKSITKQRTRSQQMVELGDMSSLGAEIGAQIDFNDPTAHKGQCTYYGRDRGETDVGTQTYNDVDDFVTHYADAVQYMYLWNGNEWIVTTAT